MNTTIESLDTIRLPFMQITPTIWHDGDMCGIANLNFKIYVGPIGWLITNAILQACK